MCRLCEEMSRKVYTIEPTVLIPRKLYRKLSPILLIFVQGNFSFGVAIGDMILYPKGAINHNVKLNMVHQITVTM